MDSITLLRDMEALPATLIVLAVIFVVTIVAVILRVHRKNTVLLETLGTTDKSGELITGEEGVEDKLPCYLVKDNGEIVASTIRMPLGYVFIADASMAFMGIVGACYLAKAVGNEVEAYDPREETYKAETSPQYAYFATHWEVVREVFKAIKPWWESAPLWVTAVVLVILFMAVLVFGG